MNEKPRIAGFFYVCAGLSQGVGIQEKRLAADMNECTQRMSSLRALASHNP